MPKIILFQIIPFSISTQFISIRPIGPYHVLPLWARVGQGAMAIKDYSGFPKLQQYWNLTIRLFSVMSKTFVGDGYPFAEMLHILQPQPIG